MPIHVLLTFFDRYLTAQRLVWSAQIAVVIYALSNIPGIHLEGYESKGDCHREQKLQKLQDMFFHFLPCHAVPYCELFLFLSAFWSGSMWQFKFQLQDYVIGASMILVAVYFICRESLAELADWVISFN